MNLFDVGKSREFSFQQLGELNLHGKLTIKNLQNIENPSDALAMDLENKTQLVELVLEWDNSVNDDSARERDGIVIENLQPSKHLEKLSIRQYGGRQFPCWLSDKLLWNMVSLTLENCQSCQQLPSLGALPFLKKLMISRLNGIVSIDTNFYESNSCSFTSLETLEFSWMKEWGKWESEAVTGAFPRLQHLSIMHCPKLKGQLPEQLVHLKNLRIWDCKQLVASVPMIPEIHDLHLRNCGKLQFNYHPTTLKKLTVGGDNMDALLVERIEHMISVISLEYLRIEYCPNMNISSYHSFLVELRIQDSCDSLTTFRVDSFPALRRLFLIRCRNLQIISQGHVHNHLQHLSIDECPKLESLPERMDIPSLRELTIKDCPKVESFPVGGLPSNLKWIYLINVSKLMADLKRAVERLIIGGMSDVECLPQEGLVPLSLTFLGISNCENLKQLDYKGLCQLSSLKELCLYHCLSLESLPEEGLPKSISILEIRGCPLLKQRCQKAEGEDWPKIAHIQHLSIL